MLDLKSKAKKASKKKRGNIFGDEDQGKKKTKIKLTHVDEYKEKPEEKLVIKPESLKSSFYNDHKRENSGMQRTKPETEAKPEFGLLVMEGEHEDKRGERKIKLPGDDAPLPEITQEEEYEKVPIEDFGDALLRGMGWNGQDEQIADAKVQKPPVPRPQYLGIGAKALPDHDTAKKNDREASFMPVVKIDRSSGKKID